MLEGNLKEGIEAKTYMGLFTIPSSSIKKIKISPIIFQEAYGDKHYLNTQNFKYLEFCILKSIGNTNFRCICMV